MVKKPFVRGLDKIVTRYHDYYGAWILEHNFSDGRTEVRVHQIRTSGRINVTCLNTEVIFTNRKKGEKLLIEIVREDYRDVAIIRECYGG